MVAIKTRSFILKNQWGWVLIYKVTDSEPWSDVTIVRKYRGEPVGPDLIMNVVHARDHYRCQLRAGFTTGQDF